MQTVYAKYDNIENLLNEYKKEFEYNYSKDPIDKYQIEYFGDKKLILLRHLEPDRFRGALAARIRYIDKDGDSASLFPSIVLYLPQNRSLDKGLMMRK